MNGTIKRIGSLVMTVLLTSLLCIVMYYHDNKYVEKSPQAIDGLLVIQEDSLQTYPVRHLVSGWLFYPDVLLTPNDFSDGSPNLYRITTAIGQRTRFTSIQNPNNPHGSGTYLLNMSLPEEMATYALELPEIYSAYQLYVNDRLVLQMGNPDPHNYIPRTQNRTITFEASQQARILIAVSDYSHVYSGMVYPPAFGTPLAVNTTNGLRMGIALFVNTIALLAALLALYFGYRMKHQNAKLFSLLCIIMCCFTSYSLLHSMFALPVFLWYALEMTSGYLLVLLLVILYNRICDIGLIVKRSSVTVAGVFCVLVLGYGLFSSYLSVSMIQFFSTLLFYYKLAVPSCLLVTAFLALRSGGNEKATPLFYASIIYATTFVWDRIFPAYEPILSGWFIEWGSLALVFAIGYTLWRDITTAHQNNILFVQEHRLMARQLAMQTEYARQMQKSNEASKRLTHDFRHRLRVMLSLSMQIESVANTEASKQELIAKITESTDDFIPPYRNLTGQFSKNIAVDALLQYYFAVASEHNIQSEFSVTIPQPCPLADAELCTVLGNLLENAVEACRRYESTNKYIKIITESTTRTLIILVINSYDGTYQKKEGRFLSRKTNELRYGIGLESVQHTVNQHKGTLHVFPEEDRFRVRIALRRE